MDAVATEYRLFTHRIGVIGRDVAHMTVALGMDVIYLRHENHGRPQVEPCSLVPTVVASLSGEDCRNEEHALAELASISPRQSVAMVVRSGVMSGYGGVEVSRRIGLLCPSHWFDHAV